MTVRARDLQKYTEIKPCIDSDGNTGHNVFLSVHQQEFCITRHAGTKGEADWMRRQLCLALSIIVNEMGDRRD